MRSIRDWRSGRSEVKHFRDRSNSAEILGINKPNDKYERECIDFEIHLCVSKQDFMYFPCILLKCYAKSFKA